MNSNSGWYGSIRPCEAVYSDHWGLPLWNVCDAHIERAEKDLPPQEMPAGFFPTEVLAREWLTYIKQRDHPKNSLPRSLEYSFAFIVAPCAGYPYRSLTRVICCKQGWFQPSPLFRSSELSSPSEVSLLSLDGKRQNHGF
jgi:hypothetical protein